jgi:hypothetical protein
MVALLVFTICSASPDPAIGWQACEEGEVRARSCEVALAYVRAGLRSGQTLHVSSCEVA